MTTRPNKAPLRKITGYVPLNPRLRRNPDFRQVLLECGHAGWIRFSSNPARTRCERCMVEAQNAWDDDHRCPHGIIDPEREWFEWCDKCKISDLEAEVARLRAVIDLGGFASDIRRKIQED